MSNVRIHIRERWPKLVQCWRYARTFHLRIMTPRRVFSRIYRGNKWGSHESRSGAGSDQKQTEAIRRALPAVIEKFHCRSIVDIPCGDFAWMKLVDLRVPYVGADIVSELVDRNRRDYGNKFRTFAHLDMIQDKLPKADLVLCRDGLVHLSFVHIWSSLTNIKASGSTYLLTTTFISRADNEDIPTGAWRPLNLERPPFSFPPPLTLIDEKCPYIGWDDKYLGLWKLADIPDRPRIKR